MREKFSRLIPELKVKDFRRSLEFYTSTAKFVVLYDRPEEEFAMLDKEGSQIMIESVTSKSRRWTIGPLEHPFGRGIHFQIEVDNVVGLYNNFKANNYPIFFELEEKWYRRNSTELGNHQFLVQDPDGYLLRFFQNLGERKI